MMQWLMVPSIWEYVLVFIKSSRCINRTCRIWLLPKSHTNGVFCIGLQQQTNMTQTCRTAEPPLPLKQTQKSPARLMGGGGERHSSEQPSGPLLWLWSGRVKEPVLTSSGGWWCEEDKPYQASLSPVPSREGRLLGAGKESCQLCLKPVFSTSCYWMGLQIGLCRSCKMISPPTHTIFISWLFTMRSTMLFTCILLSQTRLLWRGPV